jgi:hypothetical protein
MNQTEFDKLYYSKKATELLLERVFKPEKYPEFHTFLDQIHEQWIKDMT